jgi:LPXTG-motif cell wall-anchored protein
MVRKLRVALVVAATVVAGLLIAAAPAVAADPPSLTGSATPAAVHGAGTVVFTYTIAVPVAIESTSLTTHQAAALPASAAGVTLDGKPVPAAQITQPNAVDITIHTGAAATDGLAAGVHTIRFNASAGATPAVETSSSATLSWVQASVPATLDSPAVAVAVNQPDIAVTNLVPGEDEFPCIGTPCIGTGVDVQFDVDVANLGFGTPQTTLTISLPAGLVLFFAIRDADADGGPTLTCTQITTAPPQYTCPLGSLPHGIDDPTIQIFVTTTADPPVGTVATMTVSAAPDAGEGTDTNPANNSASTPVKFTGSAALQATITPAATQIHVGGQTTVRLTIHNAGPDPAEQTTAFVDVSGIGDKTGKTPSCCVATGFTGHVAGNEAVSASGVTWLVGTLAPGASITAILTVKAEAAGASQIDMTPLSTAGNPRCPNGFGDCAFATARITAVLAQAAPPPPQLPATGATTWPLIWLGLALIAAGATLTYLGRRRGQRRDELVR